MATRLLHCVSSRVMKEKFIFSDKKNLNIFLCLFGHPPSPPVYYVHLHYALIGPAQRQKYLLNHKDQFFFFWC